MEEPTCLKRSRSTSNQSEDTLPAADFAAPLARPVPGEQMSQYLQRLRASSDPSVFKVVQCVDEPGLYVGKRQIHAAAGSQAALLELAGTVFYHVIVYVKEADKLVALDFGPSGGADITANLTEAAPAGPILHDPAELPADKTGQLPLLRVCTACLPLSSPLVQQALEFAQGQAYHAFANNCIATTDFLVRALTAGAVRGAPLVFDALCGSAAEQDPPLLLMFMLMTRVSWFDVCDGSRLAAAFLQQRAAAAPTPAKSEAGPAPAASSAPAAKAAQHAEDLAEICAELSSNSMPRVKESAPFCAAARQPAAASAAEGAGTGSEAARGRSVCAAATTADAAAAAASDSVGAGAEAAQGRTAGGDKVGAAAHAAAAASKAGQGTGKVSAAGLGGSASNGSVDTMAGMGALA